MVSIKTGELDAFREEETIDVRAEHIPITGDKGAGRYLFNIYFYPKTICKRPSIENLSASLDTRCQ